MGVIGGKSRPGPRAPAQMEETGGQSGHSAGNRTCFSGERHPGTGTAQCSKEREDVSQVRTAPHCAGSNGDRYPLADPGTDTIFGAVAARPAAQRAGNILTAAATGLMAAATATLFGLDKRHVTIDSPHDGADGLDFRMIHLPAAIGSNVQQRAQL